MKKIVFFSGGIHRSGGTERVLTTVANGLASRDYEVVIVSLCGTDNYYPINKNIKVIYINSKSLSSGILKNIKSLKNILKEEKPDYWVDVDYILGVYTDKIRKVYPQMKWISWEHFCYYYQYPYYKGLRKMIRKRVCKKADCLVVLSKEDEKDYKDNIEVKGILKQIYNPLPFEVYTDDAKREKIILAAGRLVKIKGFDILIEAWNQISNQYPDWSLVIAGEGEERNNLENLIKAKNIKNVLLPGLCDNIQEYYQKASIFALSSRNEGFVMTLMEAMSHSIPAVAFDCKAGVKELIENGKTGYIVAMDDIQDFSRKLSILMDSEAKRSDFGQKSVVKVKNFTKDRIIDEWEDLLKSINCNILP